MVRVQGGCSAGDGRAGRANLHPDAMQPDLPGGRSLFKLNSSIKLVPLSVKTCFSRSINRSRGSKNNLKHKEIKLVPITVTGLK